LHAPEGGVVHWCHRLVQSLSMHFRLIMFRVCFCFSLVREVFFLKKAPSQSQSQPPVSSAIDKGAFSDVRELGELGEARAENVWMEGFVAYRWLTGDQGYIHSANIIRLIPRRTAPVRSLCGFRWYPQNLLTAVLKMPPQSRHHRDTPYNALSALCRAVRALRSCFQFSLVLHLTAEVYQPATPLSNSEPTPASSTTLKHQFTWGIRYNCYR